jgi:GNAT superfamily N-acetyltransferase
MNLLIRQANFSDLEILNQYLPTNIPHFHEDKIRQQESGDSLWLIAWKENIPAGHLQIRWTGSKIDKVNKIINNCPNIESVGVSEEYRRQGVGTQLTVDAIKLVKEKDIHK